MKIDRKATCSQGHRPIQRMNDNARSRTAIISDDIEVAKVLPYQPNTLVAFMNTPEAVHSTNNIVGPPRRYTFTCAYADIKPRDAVLVVGGAFADTSAITIERVHGQPCGSRAGSSDV